MAMWDKLTSRGDVEDRRGMAPTLGGIGIGGVALYLLANVLLGGEIDPNLVINQLEQAQMSQQQSADSLQFEGSDEYEVFASTVLGSNNDVWQQKFNQKNLRYTPPKLVLFRTATPSSCGTATSQVGPHYCPVDQTIYLDETFFDELTQRFGAEGGDVAEAYVIAHEVGHHVQNQLGSLEQVQNAPSSQANEQSIRLELQADCFAGIWANSLRDRDIFTPGEIGEAMDAAAAVGDDRIQESVTGQVNPESWTHGSSEDRVDWFTRGYDSGDVNQCNTFE